ncbi:hypothetical protein M9H77_06388 [Catharanthus roseus]|uniref:Uncharacterized protein n=1 Tax=Catharanthus roseus TaxID=4058 RepID=A0ACC0BS62_CATRO|nr:hypothetical protein M9H77_06388 [Catharanthus roseus]
MDGIHILVEFIQIQQQTIPTTRTSVRTINMTEYETAITHMVSNEPSMLIRPLLMTTLKLTIRTKDNDVEEEDLQNPVIPVTENIMTQWESSQWYSSARYDYTHSRAFLDMDSGSPIDDLIEFGTQRLLD